jgi:integrase
VISRAGWANHSWAAQLFLHAPAISPALGHASIKTTMAHYAHVMDDDVRAAKAEVQSAETASPALQKLQGRPNLKLVG